MMSLGAGMSTGIGAAFILCTTSINPTLLASTMAFSSGVMLYVSLVEVIGVANEHLAKQHSAAEHDAPSPEVNVPSDASRHPSAVQHEHWQSSSPQGDGGGGGQATGAKWALTLPGEFEFDGAAISPGDGHLRMVT